MCLWMCIKMTTRTLPFVSLQMLEKEEEKKPLLFLFISNLITLRRAEECNPCIQEVYK